MTRITAKPRKQKRVDALARREKNIEDYKAGRLGTLILPEGVELKAYLADKLKKAEQEVENLKKAVGKS